MENYGYSALTGAYGDPIKDRAIDPKKVASGSFDTTILMWRVPREHR